jgi:hypothetical protein
MSMKKILVPICIVLFITGVNSVAGQTLIPKGSVWKYLDDGSNQDTAWKEVGFNDSGWESGPAILGYGNINAGTVSTTLSYGSSSNNKYATTYFRSTFEYSPTGEETGLIFSALVDDGAIIYVNGTEVLRINMSSGPVYYNTYASATGNESTYQNNIIPLEDIAGALSGSNVIAVELHQRSASSSDIAWDLELSASKVPIKNITQIRFGSSGDPLNGLTITWNSRGTADSIAWGYSTDLEQGVFACTKREHAAVTLFDYSFPALASSSIIHYVLFDSRDSIWTAERTFQTATDASQNQFSFTAFGDSRSYPEEWQIISEATLDTDFTLFLGDIVNNGGSQSDWAEWFEYGEEFITRELIYHSIGNHDEDDSPSGFDTYLSMFTLPGNELYYSFTYGNAIFICLNTEDPGDPEQYNWLLSTLNANKDLTWKIAFFHRPFYTSPSQEGEMDYYFHTWWKAFDDHGVDMIFNGHTHNYQRSKPINRKISTTSPVASYGSGEGQGRCEVVAGSAGAPLSGLANTSLWWLEKTRNKRHFCNIDIDGKKLNFKAMDANQTVIDEFVLQKNSTGTGDVSSDKNIVYPNPSKGEFYITVTPGEMFSYRIFNSVGQLISELQNVQETDVPVLVDLKMQSRGIYFIEIRTEKKTSIEKIILY